MPHSEIEKQIQKKALAVVTFLRQQSRSLAVAESITGGGFTYHITDIPGASESLKGGIVAYTADAKISQIGVKAKTIDTCGIVSKEVAIEMAQGARKLFGSDIALGVTGYAGPSGGDKFAPIGTVYWGYVDKREEDFLELKLTGDRFNIRQRAILHGMDWILKKLK